MGVYLNYVTVLMEFVKFKAYAKQDGTMLSVTKVHLLYYINIVEKVGNVLINFFFFFFFFLNSPLGQVMQSENRHSKFTYIHKEKS